MLFVRARFRAAYWQIGAILNASVGDAPGSQIPDELRTLLYDPQTAGGLLVSVLPMVLMLC